MSAAPPKRLGHAVMLIVEGKGKYNHLVLATRSWRSKWWTLTCFCSRSRKDGSCQQIDKAVALVKPQFRDRLRFEHRRSERA
jgi:hypothetical protein